MKKFIDEKHISHFARTWFANSFAVFFCVVKVRQIAPEFYDHLASHSSWTHVIYKYITDPTVGPFSRTMRKSNVVTKTD
jgi:hypothetical protein